MNQSTLPTDIRDFHATVLSHAKTRPDAIAAVHGAREITYARFAADIEKVSRVLNGYRLAQGSRAMLFFASPYLHWLCIIALWRLGVVSVSVYDLARKDLFDLLRPNVLITERGNLKAEGGAMIALSEDMLDGAVDDLPPLAPRTVLPDQPTRILTSSGTTGLPKKILFTNALILERIKRTIADYGIEAGHRFMSVVGTDTAGGFVYSVVTWAAGGAVAFYDGQKPLAAQVDLTRANLLFMSPVQASGLVESLPADFVHPGATLVVAGGRLPQVVAERAKARLASAIWVVYGSTEAGTVTLTQEPDYANPDMVGPVVDTAEVRIVDEAGAPLPHGARGELCVRGVCCVTSYLEDPEATRAHFKDGWFYPGDLAVLSEAGVLSIVGRVSDIMNLGGVKIAPGTIEDALMGTPGVQDLAAFSVPDEKGTETLWVALRASSDYDEAELQRRYSERFHGKQAPNVALVEEIPRNAMTKVMRNALRERVLQTLARRAATAAIPTITFGKSQNKEIPMATVKINDKEYEFDTLPEEVKAQLATMQYIDAELHRLGMQRAALQTARGAYAKAVGEALKQ